MNVLLFKYTSKGFINIATVFLDTYQILGTYELLDRMCVASTCVNYSTNCIYQSSLKGAALCS